jgi:hypothetical protein
VLVHDAVTEAVQALPALEQIPAAREAEGAHPLGDVWSSGPSLMKASTAPCMQPWMQARVHALKARSRSRSLRQLAWPMAWPMMWQSLTSSPRF